MKYCFTYLSLICAFLLMYACSQKSSFLFYETCKEKYYPVAKAARDGDIATVEKFLKKGGDPNFECWGRNGLESLADIISSGDNYEMTEMYLKYDVSGDSKAMFFISRNITDSLLRRDDIINLMIRNNTYYKFDFCELADTMEIAILIDQFGYDINKINNSSQSSALISFTSCDYYLSTEEMIEGIKFFIRRGADIHHVAKDGSDVFTYVKDPVVIEFLKSLLE